jgi:hypothetical protein
MTQDEYYKIWSITRVETLNTRTPIYRLGAQQVWARRQGRVGSKKDIRILSRISVSM